MTLITKIMLQTVNLEYQPRTQDRDCNVRANANAKANANANANANAKPNANTGKKIKYSKDNDLTGPLEVPIFVYICI